MSWGRIFSIFLKVRRCVAFLFAVVPVEFLEGEAVFVGFVVGEDEGFGVAYGAGVAVAGGAGDGFGGDAAGVVPERLFVQAVAVGVEDLGDAFDHAGGQGLVFAFPGAQGEAEGAVQEFVAVPVMDEFQGTDGADGSRAGVVGEFQPEDGGDEVVDDDLFRSFLFRYF